MSSCYKITYFNGCGRAETIRMVFAAAGVPFDDVRIPMDQWPQLKQTTPLGGLPLLEFENMTMCQSLSIARYLAKKFDLAGKTDIDQFRTDMIVDCIEDAILPIRMFGNAASRSVYQYVPGAKCITQSSATEEQLAEMKRDYIERQLPFYLTRLEKLLESNNDAAYFVGDDLTWADLHFLCFDGRLNLYVGLENPLDDYPKLKALVQRVSQLPRISEWMAKRPVTPF